MKQWPWRRACGTGWPSPPLLRQVTAPSLLVNDEDLSEHAEGYDCGSGPTESQCGTLTARVKGAGMRWDADNAESMMVLAALDHSRLWAAYWTLQRAA